MSNKEQGPGSGSGFEKKVSELSGVKNFDEMIKKFQEIFMSLGNKISTLESRLSLLENGDDYYEQWREDAANDIRSGYEEDRKSVPATKSKKK